MKKLTGIAVLLLVLSTVTFGKVKHSRKSTSEHMKLVEAFTQRTLPGIPGAQPTTQTHFIIVWLDSKYPKSFFWRGENGFLNCNIERAHKISKKEQGKFPPGIEYMTEVAGGDQIHKGDTLQLTPVTGGRFPVPKEISKTAKNTIFYRVGESKWLGFSVNAIGKKTDIAMP